MVTNIKRIGKKFINRLRLLNKDIIRNTYYEYCNIYIFNDVKVCILFMSSNVRRQYQISRKVKFQPKCNDTGLFLSYEKFISRENQKFGSKSSRKLLQVIK